jgi:hypothetical protein
MKKISITFFAILITFASLAQEASVQIAPKIEFEVKLFDFGVISQGDTIRHTFTFQNNGTAPLNILSARGSCGCTVPTYSKTAVAPGESGKVDVKFNSAGKLGGQNKTVTLITNDPTNRQVILTVRGSVVRAIPEDEKKEE